jgi:chromosome segregation ATPase
MATSSAESGGEAALVGQLEEQLDALARTKQELRSVRTGMAALEHELYTMSAANEELRRQLRRKDEEAQRQLRRYESLQAQAHALRTRVEGARAEAAGMREQLSAGDAERRRWRDRCLVQQQRLEVTSRANAALLHALRAAASRLLAPQRSGAGGGAAGTGGGEGETAAGAEAWRLQLHGELAALLRSELLAQAC